MFFSFIANLTATALNVGLYAAFGNEFNLGAAIVCGGMALYFGAIAVRAVDGTR